MRVGDDDEGVAVCASLAVRLAVDGVARPTEVPRIAGSRVEPLELAVQYVHVIV